MVPGTKVIFLSFKAIVFTFLGDLDLVNGPLPFREPSYQLQDVAAVVDLRRPDNVPCNEFGVNFIVVCSRNEKMKWLVKIF